MSAPAMERRTLYLANAEDTRALGQRIGEAASSGTLIALSGDLGAGKTCLTQGIARGLLVPESIPVSSPTFSLIHEYPGRLPVHHMDFYRLNTGEIEEMGLEEVFESEGVFIAEWAEHWPDYLEWAHLRVQFLPQRSNGRQIEVATREPSFLHLLDTWQASPENLAEPEREVEPQNEVNG